MQTEEIKLSRAQRRAETPRKGIAPPILISQIRNTAPFILHPGFTPGDDEPHLSFLRRAAETLDREPLQFEDPARYFELCLATHHATVATFVPTDVDNHIRFKLWPPSTPIETIIALADTVLASRGWSNRSVSTRTVTSPDSGERLSGHHGEWFSTAVAALGALRRRAPERASAMREAIVAEALREETIYLDFRNRKDGLNLLRAATVIAHNLGDLNRVVDMWEMEDEELTGLSARPVPAEAAELNRAFMATENHRHFPLRGPRALRRSAEFLLPIGPFFDEWGSHIARHPELAPEEIGEIAEALVDGWDRLAADAKGPAPIGYARALAGIEESFPGGLNELANQVPTRIAKKFKTGALRSHSAIPRSRFEGHWNQAALKHLKL